MPNSQITSSQPDFRVLFESAPGLYLVLTPDLKIVAVSDAYLRATMTKREDILGRGLFEVFPDNPADPAATGVQNLRASLGRVLQSREADAMPVQKYDIRRPESEGGGFEERYWNPVNSPVFGAGGEIAYIIHRVEDVTVEHAAQRALRDSEARYRTLFDSIDEGFCVIEMIFDAQEKPVDYRFLEINPSFEKQTGLRDAVGKRMRELAPQHEAHWFEIYGRIAVTGEAVRFQNRAEQLQRTYDVYAFRFGDPKHRQVAILFNDITEREQMAEALRRSEESLSVTLHSIGDAVLATDTKGRITRLNPVAEKLTGWTQAEALGRPVAEVFRILNEETRQPSVIPVAQVLATGEIQGLANHTILIARDGTERPIADSAAPIRDREGRTVGVVLVFRDVTQERRAVKELRHFNVGLEELVAQRTAETRQQAQLNQLLLENLTEGVVACDAEGKLTLFNRVAREWHGTDPRVLPPEAWSAHDHLCEADGVTPLARERIPLLRALHGEQVRDAEVSIVRNGVPPRLVLASGAPLLDADGRKYGAVVVMRDITERQRHERLALRSQRLEAIGTLAGGIAHDLNNALAPIMISAELLRMRFPGESQTLDLIGISAKRAADMVRQLLSFAKGAEGERVSFQPGRLVKEMEKIMQGSFPKNIQLLVKCAPRLPTVLGDATQLHQVLLNLCVNARDAMPHGGTLTLEAEGREVDAVYASSVPGGKPGSYLALRVRDTGTGIPPEILDRIFDPFFTTKGPDKGTGLGLSTVMGIVKGHGGFLQVYAQPGQGSTFTVYLPVGRPDHDDTEIKARAKVEFHGQGETILLVDDEVAVREMSRAVLRRLNFKPLAATDGADGLMQAAEYRKELRAIITDLHMPHMDGLAFVRALRRMLPDLPVVVASGRMEDAVAGEFKALGVTNFLDKPFTEAQLAEALKILLAEK